MAEHPQPRPTLAAQALYRDVLLDEDLMALREEFVRTAVEQLANVSGWLGMDAFLGTGDVYDTSALPEEADPDRYAAFQGAAAVVEMSAQLAVGALAMLDDDRRYAAAAMVRQLIETEYLLRAFAGDIDRAAEWCRATPDEIRKAFSPKTMRSLGGFSDREYWTHCDQGGHPSPLGRPLLSFTGQRTQSDQAITAALWGDLAQHMVRVWSSVHELLSGHHARYTKVRAAQIATVDEIRSRWEAADPLHQPVNYALLNKITGDAEPSDQA